MKKIIKNRDSYVREISRAKNVLHIGACDSPFTKEKFETNALLYQKIDMVCNKQLGIDLDKKSIVFLNKQEFQRSTVIYSDMNQDFKNTFEADIVIFGETLEHLMNLQIALENIKNFLSSDTVLFISVPNAFYVRNFIYALFGKEWQHPDHKVAFTPKTLTALLIECKFNDINLRYGFSMNNESMNIKGRISLILLKPFCYIFPMLSANLILTCKKL